MTLEGVGVGSRFIGAHPGANLSLLLKQFHHGFDIGRIVDRTQPRENMERVLIKSHTVVGESGIPNISGMAADHPVFPRDPHHLFDARQTLHLRLIECTHIPNHVDLRQRSVSAGNTVSPGRDTGFIRQVRQHGLALVSIEGAIRVQNDNHGDMPVVTGVWGWLPHSDQEPA